MLGHPGNIIRNASGGRYILDATGACSHGDRGQVIETQSHIYHFAMYTMCTTMIAFVRSHMGYIQHCVHNALCYYLLIVVRC